MKANSKTLKTAGLVVLAAGLLAYPAMRLYKYLSTRNMAADEEGNEPKKLFQSYLGKHKPHHRKASVDHNGSLA